MPSFALLIIHTAHTHTQKKRPVIVLTAEWLGILLLWLTPLSASVISAVSRRDSLFGKWGLQNAVEVLLLLVVQLQRNLHTFSMQLQLFEVLRSWEIRIWHSEVFSSALQRNLHTFSMQLQLFEVLRSWEIRIWHSEVFSSALQRNLHTFSMQLQLFEVLRSWEIRIWHSEVFPSALSTKIPGLAFFFLDPPVNAACRNDHHSYYFHITSI